MTEAAQNHGVAVNYDPPIAVGRSTVQVGLPVITQIAKLCAEMAAPGTPICFGSTDTGEVSS